MTFRLLVQMLYPLSERKVLQWNPDLTVPRDWGNLFVKWRVRYIEHSQLTNLLILRYS